MVDLLPLKMFHAEVSGFTALGVEDAAIGMPVKLHDEVVGTVIDVGKGDYVHISFTTDSRKLHRMLASGVIEDKWRPVVRDSCVELDT